MRATAQDRDSAALVGIDTDRVYALTWSIGIVCVGVAGVLLAPIYPVYPTSGLQFVLIAYVVVVLGGVGLTAVASADAKARARKRWLRVANIPTPPLAASWPSVGQVQTNSGSASARGVM